MSGRSDPLTRHFHAPDGDGSPASPMLLIGKPGLEAACFCYVLNTFGVRVDFVDIAETPNVTEFYHLLALVQAEEGAPWREWIRFLAANARHIRLGLLMIDEQQEFEAELFDLGVSCVLVGGLTAEIAVAALQLASVGGVYAPPDIVKNAFRCCVSGEPASADEPLADKGLTSRERDIVELLRRGLQNKNIAHLLSISESTVKVHLRNIMKKLNANNRTQVAFMLDPSRKTIG